MKKGIILLLVGLMGAPVFAYECAEQKFFDQATQQVHKLVKAELPPVFYYDATEGTPDEYVQEMTCYQQRVNLFQEIDKAYRNNPNSYEAAFNYANAMMSPIYEIEGPGDRHLPKYNADNALKALKKIKGKHPADAQVWALLYKAYEYKLFGNHRAHGIFAQRFEVKGEEIETWHEDEYGNVSQIIPKNAKLIQTVDGMTLDEIKKVYAADFPATKARLETLDNLIKLEDPQVQDADYLEGALMCQVLSRKEQEVQYLAKLTETDNEYAKIWKNYRNKLIAKALMKELTQYKNK